MKWSRFFFWTKNNSNYTQITDISSSPQNKVLNLKKTPSILNIKIGRLRASLRIHHLLISIVGVGLVFLIIVLSIKTVSATTATFYPSTCLGGWQNPTNAEGPPSLDQNAQPEDYNSDNSTLLQDQSAELYCGSFAGSVPNDSAPKTFLLTLHWSVDDGSVVHTESEPINVPSQDIDSSSISETDAPNTEAPVDDSTESSTQSQPVDASSSGDASSTSLQIIQAVDTTPTTTPIDGSIEENQDSDASTTPLPIIPISDDSTSIATSATTSSNIEDSSSDKLSDPGFMEVLYTLDGTTWNSLGIIDWSNWNSIAYSLPLTGWTDLSKVQVELKPILSLDNPPVIYLDAMSITVNYESASVIDQSNNSTNSDPKKYDIIDASSTNTISLSKIEDINQGLILIVQTSGDGVIHIYNDNDPTFAMETAVTANTPSQFPSYDFDPGSYTIVYTKDQTGCMTKTEADCISDPDFVDQASFTVVTTSATPSEYQAVQEEPTNDSSVTEVLPPIINPSPQILESSSTSQDTIDASDTTGTGEVIPESSTSTVDSSSSDASTTISDNSSTTDSSSTSDSSTSTANNARDSTTSPQVTTPTPENTDNSTATDTDNSSPAPSDSSSTSGN